jgi:hypothetical protein
MPIRLLELLKLVIFSKYNPIENFLSSNIILLSPYIVVFFKSDNCCLDVTVLINDFYFYLVLLFYLEWWSGLLLQVLLLDSRQLTLLAIIDFTRLLITLTLALAARTKILFRVSLTLFKTPYKLCVML